MVASGVAACGGGLGGIDDEGGEEVESGGVRFCGETFSKGNYVSEKGRLIKTVREEAERELFDMYGVRISLKLMVKVEKIGEEF